MKLFHRSAAALVAACACAAAGAQSLDTAQRNWLDVQFFVPRIDSTARADALFSNETGTTLDLENDLHQPRTRAGLGIAYGRRIGERWRIQLGYESLHRSADAVLTRDVRFQGYDFAAGSNVRASTTVAFGFVTGGYSFVLGPTAEFGVSFGGQTVHARVDLGSVEAREGAAAVRLGLYGMRALGGNWQLVADGHVLVGREVNSSAQVQFGVQWRPNANLGVGLGVRATRYSMDLDTGILTPVPRLVYEYRAVGPYLTVGASFY
jgi:hypothetical protein